MAFRVDPLVGQSLELLGKGANEAPDLLMKMKDAKSLQEYRGAQIEEQKARTAVAMSENQRLADEAKRKRSIYDQGILEQQLYAEGLPGVVADTVEYKNMPDAEKNVQFNALVEAQLEGLTGEQRETKKNELLSAGVMQVPLTAKQKADKAKNLGILQARLKQAKDPANLVSAAPLLERTGATALDMVTTSPVDYMQNIMEGKPVIDGALMQVDKKYGATKASKAKQAKEVATVNKAIDALNKAYTPKEINRAYRKVPKTVKGTSMMDLLQTKYKSTTDPKTKQALASLITKENVSQQQTKVARAEFNQKRQLAVDKIQARFKADILLAQENNKAKAAADLTKRMDAEIKAATDDLMNDYWFFDNTGSRTAKSKKASKAVLDKYTKKQ